MSSNYDEAWICENGHTINSSVHRMPEDNAECCENCGGKTVKACPSCEKPIRGYEWGSGVIDVYTVTSYCIHCGNSFPWTQSRLEAAEELIRLNEKLSQEEKDDFVGAIKDVTKDSPKGKAAAEKIKVYGKKIGTTGYNVIIDVVSDVLSETLKKQMGL